MFIGSTASKLCIILNRKKVIEKSTEKQKEIEKEKVRKFTKTQSYIIDSSYKKLDERKIILSA